MAASGNVRVQTMNLKGLIHRELGEGMTEKELASAVQVPLRMLVKILAGKDPKDPAVWEQFARYFRMDVDFLRTGESAHARRMGERPGRTSHSAAGHMRKIPPPTWQQMGQLTTSEDLPGGSNCPTKTERVPLRPVDRAPGQHPSMKRQPFEGITGETNDASVRRYPWKRGNPTINSSTWEIVSRLASIVRRTI
jgi:hypothetical protein